jgi:hypothetical protein
VIGSFLGLTAGLTAVPSCQPAFPTEVPGRALSIAITGGDTGTPENRLPLTFTTPDVFTVTIEALDQDGKVDPTYASYVRISAEPGTVLSLAGPNTDGRNVQLMNGVATGVQVSLVGAYGNTQLLVQDLGYVPADPLGVLKPDGTRRPPQCANGKDDNDNGLIDYPADPGCYAANDDTEDGGTYAGAASGSIYFIYPTVADVEGVNNAGGGTPFPNEQVQINTGWNGSTSTTPKGVVVNGVAAEGFFVTDIAQVGGFNSLYAYTYSAPALMNVCDRLITLGGTAAEFYGFLELNYPTWSLEEWDPLARPCLVPEPTTISVAELSNTNVAAILTPLEASLVRVPPADGSTIHVASKLGPGLVTRLYVCMNGQAPSPNAANGVCADGSTPTFSAVQTPITANATSCDYEGTQKIDFSNPEEVACENACSTDVECSEYTQYITESQFQIVVTNATGTGQAAITGNGSAASEFDPLQLIGQPLIAFTGNLTYFSGGSQFTIQARCADDVVGAESLAGVSQHTILPSSPPWPLPDGGGVAPAACVINRALQGATN